MSKKPAAKDETTYYNNLVRITRQQLFQLHESENVHREALHFLLAFHIAKRDRVDERTFASDLDGFIEYNAPEIKSRAIWIIEAAKKLERES